MCPVVPLVPFKKHNIRRKYFFLFYFLFYDFFLGFYLKNYLKKMQALYEFRV